MNRSPCVILCTALALLLTAAPTLPSETSMTSDPSPQKNDTLYVVGTAHLDTQWNWTIQDTIVQFIPSTLRRNFALFEKYPDYVFSFEGAFRYMLAREYYPEEYARLKEYVAKGRWRVAGSSVDAGDVNVPSPESLMRQILYGNGFFQSEFGRTSLDIFLPDCFGFGYALPSAAAHCGLKGFSSQKLSWGAAEPVPFDVGVWEGPDGASIVACLQPGNYSATLRKDLSQGGSLMDRFKAMQQRSGFALQMKYFGVGDIGGAPDDESVAWLEKSIAGTGPIRVVSAGSDQIFRDLTPEQIARLPRHKGELLMKTHGAGCYTAQAALKRWNRKNELLADAAERAAVAADWIGALPYPRETLTRAWTRFLWHQFHDDLTGTSIPQAYLFSWNDEAISQNEFTQVLDHAVGGVARALDTRVDGVPVVVFNPLAMNRVDVVEAKVRFKGVPPRFVRVFDPDGKEVPAQTGAVTGGDTVEVVFLAEVPATGWRVFSVRPSDQPCSLSTDLRVTNSSLENARYVVRLDPNGDLAGVTDKGSGRELLSAPARLEMLFDDSGENWPAWEIRYEDVVAKPRAYVSGPAQVRIAENGPARVTLEVTRHASGSTFVQRIRLASGLAGDLVEFDTWIDWKTSETLLKAAFPLTVSNPQAVYDLGLGTIERGNNKENKYEVPAQQWAALAASDGSSGAAILNDCKYGWDKPDDHTLRLTLLHTPRAEKGFSYQNREDIGRHKMLYAIQGTRGDWRAENVPAGAARLNQPLLAWQVPPHAGPLGKSFSLLSVGNPQVAVRALKKAEANDEIIVRLQETFGKDTGEFDLKMAAPIASARELNGAEQPVGPATVKNGSLLVSMKPYEPKTFSVVLGEPPARLTPPVCKSLGLDFTLDGVSLESGKADADFDGQGRSFPGELWATALNTEGISFVLGPAIAGGKNFLPCRGQTIRIPPGDHNRLYVLAASAAGDTTGVFSVDGKPVELTVQEWTGRIGQWDTLLANGQFNEDMRALIPACLKRDPVAYVATHLHRRDGQNDPYIFGYLFRYRIDLPPGARQLTLPTNDAIRIAAVTLASNPNDDAVPVMSRDEEMFAHPRINPNGGLFLDRATVTVVPGARGEDLRYTLDGTEPSETSPRYTGPLTITNSATLAVRAFVPGRAGVLVTSAHFRKATLRKPDAVGETVPGLAYQYFEGTWDRLPDFGAREPVASGPATTVSPEPRRRNTDFGLVFTGFVKVPTDGIYTFFLKSDDGSRLYLGDEELIDHDGLHGAVERSTSIALAAGTHALRVEYFQKKGDFALEVSWEGPGAPKQPIPAPAYCRAKEPAL